MGQENPSGTATHTPNDVFGWSGQRARDPHHAGIRRGDGNSVNAEKTGLGLADGRGDPGIALPSLPRTHWDGLGGLRALASFCPELWGRKSTFYMSVRVLFYGSILLCGRKKKRGGG